jgi:hypothetical protein
LGVADSESLLSTRIERLSHHGAWPRYSRVSTVTTSYHHHTIIIPSSYHTSRTPRRHIGDTHHTSRRHSPHISATLSTHHDDTQTHHIDPQIDSTSLPSCHITLVHPIYSLFSLSTSHFSSRFAHQSDLYPHHPD